MPGRMPPTSQLDWLISTTAMIVLFWSRATRDLLKSFGWGIATLHRLIQRRSCHPRRPPHSISPQEGDGFELPVPRSMQARLKAKIAGFGCMPPSILRLPSSVAISSGAKRNLGPEPLSGAEPEVRIHLPAAAAKSPREMPWLVPPSEARLNLRSPSATRARREADRFASRAADQV